MNLFDRLPQDLFAPLTGRNNRRAWELLGRLFDRFFSSDCVPPFPEGFLREQVVKEVERFLLDRGWEQEAGNELAPNTPLVIQANQLVARLVDTGWLVQERVGFRQFLSMQDRVVRLLEIMQQFVAQGPALVSGDILLVYNQLREVARAPRTQAAGFISAAKLCVGLINSLRATTARIGDLMKELTQESDTPIYVRRFFTEHISELYVRDFKQLRTENHPIRLRFDILEIVNKFSYDDQARSDLLAGYADLPGSGESSCTEQFDADVQRFRRLLDVEKFLDRMDRVMDAATQRAIAILGYRLKASERIVEVLDDTVQAVLATADAGLPLLGRLTSPVPIIGDNRLRVPVVAPPAPVRRALKKREMTPQERAMQMLRRAMIANRDASPKALKAYVATNLPSGARVSAAQLPIKSVHDAIAYLGLARLAQITTREPEIMRRNPLLRNLGFRVTLVPGVRADTKFFNTPDFTIERN